MRQLTAFAAFAALIAPSAAHAQSAGALATPYDQVIVVEAPPGQLTTPPAYATPAPVGSSWRMVGPDDEVPPAFRADGAPVGRAAIRQARRDERARIREERRAEERANGGPGFGASFGHSWIGFSIGAGGGLLIGGTITAAACSDGGSDVPMCPLLAIAGGVGGAMIAAPFGAGLSVWAFADSRGGTGNAFAAIGGAYLGGGIGVGIAAAFTAGNLGAIGAIAGPIVGLVLTNLGAAAGYHLSSHGPRRDAVASASPGVFVMPTLAPTDDGQGAIAGAAGTF